MTKLEFVNKFILQWLFVRLTKHIGYVDNKLTILGWTIQYWVVPLSGWNSNFKFIGKRNFIKIMIL